MSNKHKIKKNGSLPFKYFIKILIISIGILFYMNAKTRL